ncbi:hypothetical protein AGIG_G3946 [Arapaima gigas]
MLNATRGLSHRIPFWPLGGSQHNFMAQLFTHHPMDGNLATKVAFSGEGGGMQSQGYATLTAAPQLLPWDPSPRDTFRCKS